MGRLYSRWYIDEVLNAGNASASSGSIWLAPDRITRGQFQLVWDGDLEATLTFLGSNDFIARPDVNPGGAIWTDFTSAINPTNPAGTPNDYGITVDNLNWEFVRVDVARTAGEGRFRLAFAGSSA